MKAGPSKFSWFGLVLGMFVLLGIASGTPVSYAGAPQQDSKASITILPIDNAKLLVGQRLDLRVEANGLAAKPTTWDVTVNGENPDELFGKEGAVTNNSETSQEQTWRDITFAEAGDYTVLATITAGDVLTKEVTYNVVAAEPTETQAKNVILFIGDGLSLPMRTAARIVSQGVTEGKYNGLLAMDDMDASAFITTSGMDSIATDSANSAAAYATGNKSAVNAMGVYPDNTEDPLDDPRVETIGELVKRARDMSFGIVSTSEVQDATPAAMFSHTRRRSEYPAIMDQMLNPAQAPDVILGGGSASLLPQTTPGSRRKDDRDLFEEFDEAGYTIVTNAKELSEAGTPEKLLGMFHTGNMNVYLDKGFYKNPDVLKTFDDQPMLWDMTKSAIDVLSQNPNGFFLMVEGASIDKQAHNLDWERTVWDTIEFDKAVGVAQEWAAENGEDTLIIVVADHSHGMSITGTYWEGDGKTGREAVRVYQEAKFPDYVDEDGDGFPDDPKVTRPLAIQWSNHPDFYDDFWVNEQPIALAVVEGDKAVANKERDGETGELFNGNIPSTSTSGVHTVEDVPLTAMGPGAEQFRGTMDNTEVFFAIMNALGLDATQGDSPFATP